MAIDNALIASIGGNYLAGREAGTRNALVLDEVARDRDFRNALAQHMPAEGVAPNQNAIAAMMQLDPERALPIIQQQQQQAQMQRREQAMREYTEAQFVFNSERPAMALRLIDKDGALLRQLEEAGMIDSADGISDDEARIIAKWGMDTVAPFAGIGGGEERAPPADLRMMEALGFPMTPEGFAEYNAARGSEGGAEAMYQALLAQLAVAERQDTIARRQREDEAAATEERKARLTQQNTVNRSLKQTGEIVKLAEKLEGTFLEAGVPLADLRRTLSGAAAGIGSIIGADTAKARQINAAYDKLKKNTADQLINLMSSGGLGEATNSKLEQYQKALASPETSVGAILSIQANIAEMLLDQADVEGYVVEDREKIEEQIAAMRAYSVGEAKPESNTVDLGNGVTLEFLE